MPKSKYHVGDVVTFPHWGTAVHCIGQVVYRYNQRGLYSYDVHTGCGHTFNKVQYALYDLSENQPVRCSGCRTSELYQEYKNPWSSIEDKIARQFRDNV